MSCSLRGLSAADPGPFGRAPATGAAGRRAELFPLCEAQARQLPSARPRCVAWTTGATATTATPHVGLPSQPPVLASTPGAASEASGAPSAGGLAGTPPASAAPPPRAASPPQCRGRALGSAPPRSPGRPSVPAASPPHCPRSEVRTPSCGAVITPWRHRSLKRATSRADWHLLRAGSFLGFCFLTSGLNVRLSRPLLSRPPPQLTPEPREATPAGLAQGMVPLLDGLGSSRALGPKQAGRDPAPPPAQLFPPMFVVPKEARRGRAPAPPYWPAQSRARNQLGPAAAEGCAGPGSRGPWRLRAELTRRRGRATGSLPGGEPRPSSSQVGGEACSCNPYILHSDVHAYVDRYRRTRSVTGLCR